MNYAEQHDSAIALRHSEACRHHDIAIDAIDASRMLRLVSEVPSIHQRDLRITTSTGVGCYPGNRPNAETLPRHPETAMYEGRNDGRNRYQLLGQTMRSGALDHV